MKIPSGKILPNPKYELKFDELCRIYKLIPNSEKFYNLCEIYKRFRSAPKWANLFIEELFKESVGSNLSQPKIDIKLFFESFFIFYKNI